MAQIPTSALPLLPMSVTRSIQLTLPRLKAVLGAERCSLVGFSHRYWPRVVGYHPGEFSSVDAL